MTNAKDKLPPSNQDAELTLLGSILMDPANAMADAISLGATTEWFYDLRYATLFSAISAMVDDMKPVDMVTLSDELRKRGLYDKIGGATFMAGVFDAGVSPASIPYYADMLRGLMLARKTLQVCAKISLAVSDDPAAIDKILDDAESGILAVRQEFTIRGAKTIRELMPEVTDRLEDRWVKGKCGTATGFIDIDKASGGGVQDGDVWVIAARPSQGKTALAMDIANRVASRYLDEWMKTADPAATYDGEHVAVFSLEMSDVALAERLLANRARLNTKKEVMTVADQAKLAAHVPITARLPILIDSSSALTIKALKARARRYYSRNKARLFIVDYLQLLEGEDGSGEDRRVQVDGISRGLKSLAKELNVPIIAVAQLNREFERDEVKRKPRMADLREAGGIEQDADVILFLYPDATAPADIEPTKPRTIFCRFGKQRNNGRDFDVRLTFFPDQTRFENGAYFEPPASLLK